MKRLSLLTLLTFTVLAATVVAQPAEIDGKRPNSSAGINMFEGQKPEISEFNGVRLFHGGFFSQDFQSLTHENANGGLIYIGDNFNTAQANWTMDMQLERGVYMHLTTYLSSRHHNEAWVKGGYIRFEALPFLDVAALNRLMEFTTIKIGHYDVNYGDAHFRRTDGANSLYNPFVENYIMDGYSTEIGGEVQMRFGDLLTAVSVTNGEINGRVDVARRVAPAYIAKVAYDTQVNDDLRVRISGSAYTTRKSNSNTLYGGDRTGSRYYLVTEATGATAAAAFTSGRFNPGFRNDVTAWVINPFVKFQGFEVFANIESATGSGLAETSDRKATQFAVDGIFRFLENEQAYVGARYNTVNAELTGADGDISINRMAFAGGWFLTPNVQAKVEYVTQSYDGYATARFVDLKFKGVMVSATIGF